jgi:hypothetical protein
LKERGDAVRKGIVKDITIGKTTYVFHDDHCWDKTSKEVNAILEQFSSTAFLGLKSSLLSEKDRLIDDKQNIDK